MIKIIYTTMLLNALFTLKLTASNTEKSTNVTNDQNQSSSLPALPEKISKTNKKPYTDTDRRKYMFEQANQVVGPKGNRRILE